MKIPSEAELIEMEGRFRFLLEIADEQSAEAARLEEIGKFQRAEGWRTNAQVLELLYLDTRVLVEAIRAGAWVVLDAR